MNSWIKNTGGCPVESGTEIDIKLHEGSELLNVLAHHVGDSWTNGTITHWRLHEKQPKEIFFGLEEAYDIKNLKRPESKYSVATESVKKSAEAIVAEHFNANYQTNLNEVHIRMISVALQSLKDMEK